MNQTQIDQLAERMRIGHYQNKEMVMTVPWDVLPEHRRDNWRQVVALAQSIMLDPIREALIKVIPRDMFDPDAKAEPGKNVWRCKVGYALDGELPNGSDAPMRNAVEKAFVDLVGDEPDFIFSGWGAILTPGEENVVNNNDEIDLAHMDAWNKVRELIHGPGE